MKRIFLFFLSNPGTAPSPAPGRPVSRPLFLGIVAGFLLAACDNGIFGPSYTVELPPAPPSWLEILGYPHWRLEWVNNEGIRESRD
ncbi:MAG: hypothetical protein LBT95_04090, partial [Treponema sp.]|nr:hypothetical protein [Treponema sp.]